MGYKDENNFKFIVATVILLFESFTVTISKCQQGGFIGQVYVLTGTIREFVTFCELNFFACHVLKRFTLNLGPGEKF